MAILSINDLSEHLSLTGDEGNSDLVMLARLIDSAQGHIERLLGYQIEAQFGGVDQSPIPPSLVQAVKMLAAHWYDQREAAGEGMKAVPFGVTEIVNEYREFTF